MPIEDSVHTDRGRAESFGSLAAEYDRFRPSYPDALINDLADLNPDRALDIACGTGKVAVALLACGIAVLGVDIDTKMAAVARSHGIIVEVDAFETWDDDGRTFDLITCGQAWHWIQPEKGAAKVARLLRPRGTLALFWNYPGISEELQRDMDQVYAKYAPELARTRPDEDHYRHHLDALKATGSFGEIETKHYRWEEILTGEEWIGRTTTQSDHARLPADQHSALFDSLRVLIEKHDGIVSSESGTFTIFARNRRT